MIIYGLAGRDVVRPALPTTRQGVAADGEFGAGNLIGEGEHPAEVTELGVDVGDAKITPSGAVGVVIADTSTEWNVGEDRFAVVEIVGIWRRGMHGDEELAVGQLWLCEGDGVVERADNFAEGVVVARDGDVAPPHREVGVAGEGAGGDFPADASRRHFDAVGVEEESIGGNGTGICAEGEVGDFLLA